MLNSTKNVTVLIFTCLIVILTNTRTAHAQSFIIRSSQDDSPIPYVNVIFLHSDSIVGTTYSNSKGQVFNEFENVERISISHISFEPQTINIKDITSVILLVPATHLLNEVTIIPNAKKKVITLGEKPKRGLNTSISWSCRLKTVSEVLMLLKNPYNEDKQIKSFDFFTSSKFTKVNDYLVKIVFYTNVNGQLGEKLPFEIVKELTNKDRKNVVVDVSERNIWLPEEGLFIGLEMIGCKAVIEGADSLIVDNDYSPRIVYNIAKNESEHTVHISRHKTSESEWYYSDFGGKELELFGGILSPAFLLEVFE